MIRMEPGPAASKDPWRGLFRLTDPRITLASVSSMIVGLAAASAAGPIAWGWFGLTVVGILAIEAAKNASGAVFDHDSGVDLAVDPLDRSPFSGGKRVLVDGLMTRHHTILAAAAFYFLGIIPGVVIVGFREPSVLWLGLAGIGLAYFYHAPPFRLSYRGLGELAVALAYGPLISLGVYLVQRQSFEATVVWASIPLGLLIAAFLWINEFPDHDADAASGKRTLVVRLGRRRASRVFGGLVLLAFLILLLLPRVGLPVTAWLGWIGAPHGFAAARRLWLNPEDTRAILPAQAWTLTSFVLEAIGVAVGLAMA